MKFHDPNHATALGRKPRRDAAATVGCPKLGWISLTTLQEVDIYQQMTVVTLVF